MRRRRQGSLMVVPGLVPGFTFIFKGGFMKMVNYVRGNSYKSEEYLLTDVRLLEYKEFFNKPELLQQLHRKMGESLLEFLAAKNTDSEKKAAKEQTTKLPNLEECMDFMVPFLSCAFLEDGTPLTDYTKLNQMVIDDIHKKGTPIEDAYSHRQKNKYGQPLSTTVDLSQKQINSWEDFDDFDEDDDYLIENKRYDVNHFIDYFSMIDTNRWIYGKFSDGNKNDVFGFLGCEQEIDEKGNVKEVMTYSAKKLIDLFSPMDDFSGFEFIQLVSCGLSDSFQQNLPKDRILAALRSLKNGSLIV
jgi:hypothetical protein